MTDKPTHDAVRLLIDRSLVGEKKYGVTLDRTDLTPLQWLTHLTEELADGLKYAMKLRAEMEEPAAMPKELRVETPHQHLVKAAEGMEPVWTTAEITGLAPKEGLSQPTTANPTTASLLDAKEWESIRAWTPPSSPSATAEEQSGRAELGSGCVHQWARLTELRTPQHPEVRTLSACMNCDALTWREPIPARDAGISTSISAKEAWLFSAESSTPAQEQAATESPASPSSESSNPYPWGWQYK